MLVAMIHQTEPEQALRLVSFVNTLHVPDGDDLLADTRGPGWLEECLGIRDSSQSGPPRGPDYFAGLRSLREALRQLAAANNGQQPDSRMLAEAAATIGSLPVFLELGDQQYGPRLEAAKGADTATRAAVALMEDYLSLRATSRWARVKTCAASDCRWAYYDTTRNASRRWCDMADCGNRAKNRAWRQRQLHLADEPAPS
jgi:predicted RNA-binding Zn ribbon-like protein